MKTDDRDPVTRLDEVLDLLPRDIEPPRDLWPAIEARLEPRADAGAPRRWAWLAAAGVLLVIGSSLITASLLRREAAVTAQVPDRATGRSRTDGLRPRPEPRSELRR